MWAGKGAENPKLIQGKGVALKSSSGGVWSLLNCPTLHALPTLLHSKDLTNSLGREVKGTYKLGDWYGGAREKGRGCREKPGRANPTGPRGLGWL